MVCTIDFRSLDEGFGGKTFKWKREAQEAALSAAIATTAGDVVRMEVEEPELSAAKRSAVPSVDNPDRPTFWNSTYDGVIAGKASGRKWKAPRKHRAAAMKASVKGTTFEERERQKEIKKAYRERMQELKETIRQNKVEKRKKREEREKKKKENILKSGTKLQKITNPKTLKKISKSKQRKQLKFVPDNLVKNRK
ncbi:hypothetical protein SAY87_002779 [Trapa incisa]|uniref:Coiled-coil domain-containing protein 86 n=1 Tax=Trapa incisa TaxID=236973 RepID=A0AAN7JXQ7_9MYRT|nr:hypothetical protein SAY87_002779 [Trapa incisa]